MRHHIVHARPVGKLLQEIPKTEQHRCPSAVTDSYSFGWVALTLWYAHQPPVMHWHPTKGQFQPVPRHKQFGVLVIASIHECERACRGCADDVLQYRISKTEAIFGDVDQFAVVHG